MEGARSEAEGDVTVGDSDGDAAIVVVLLVSDGRGEGVRACPGRRGGESGEKGKERAIEGVRRERVG